MRGINALERLEKRQWRKHKLACFELRHGYPASLHNPKTFSEKLLRRILVGEDPLYDVYAVKHLAHYFVKAHAIEGLKVARHLKVVSRIEPSDFVDLPDSFLIKSSFGSGLNEVVICKSDLNVQKVCDKFNYRSSKIKNARNESSKNNVIIFEDFIGNPEAGTPNDYKFHCFNSDDGSFSCFIQVDSDRFGDHRQTIFDETFTPIEMQFARQIRHEKTPERPEALGDMLRIARELSSGFDYIRVDLFDTDEGIFFGEMTPYHQGAMAPISPREWEERLGQLWDQRFPVFQPKK